MDEEICDVCEFDCTVCQDGELLARNEACEDCANVKKDGVLYERCDYCSEPRGSHEFQDGLRCVYCAEEQDEEEARADAEAFAYHLREDRDR
jgi:hypothetical protein